MTQQPDSDNEPADREDLDHKPENAGNVGEQHKHLNEKGEQPRPPSQSEGEEEKGPL